MLVWRAGATGGMHSSSNGTMSAITQTQMLTKAARIGGSKVIHRVEGSMAGAGEGRVKGWQRTP